MANGKDTNAANSTNINVNNKNANNSAPNNRPKKKNRLILKIILAAFVTAVIGISLIFTPQINEALGFKDKSETDASGLEAQRSKVIAGGLKLHFVDVGQGDCTVVELPDGKKMIIDGGDNKTEVINKIKNYIKDNIKDENNKTIEYFDYAILTHTDADHCGGFTEVLKSYPAETIYRPNVISNYKDSKGNVFTDPGLAVTGNAAVTDVNLKFWNADGGPGYGGLKYISTAAYKNFIDIAYKKHDKLSAAPKVIVSDGRRSERGSKPSQDIAGGEEGDPDRYTVKFFGPGRPVYKNNNDYSNVMIIEYAGETVALSGDAQTDAESDAADEIKIEYPDLNVSLIKLGHHGAGGSSNANTKKYFDALNTDKASRSFTVTVASCGLNNSYGHPAASTLKNLRDWGYSEANLLRTDLNGDINFSISAESAGLSGKTAYYFPTKGQVKENPAFLNWKYIAIILWVVLMVIIFMPVSLILKTVKNQK